MNPKVKAQLLCDALRMAVCQCQPQVRLIVHSARIVSKQHKLRMAKTIEYV